jgi:hypothetical protein
MRVDCHVSDLFFNLDHDEARVVEKGHFVRFDDTKMLEQADWFTKSIEAIGGPITAPADLVADFHARL